MEFICTHCHKPIYTMAVILDRTHFVHDGCKEEYEKKITLSEKDSEIFLGTLENAPKPNSALKRAFNRYKALVG